MDTMSESTSRRTITLARNRGGDERAPITTKLEEDASEAFHLHSFPLRHALRYVLHACCEGPCNDAMLYHRLYTLGIPFGHHHQRVFLKLFSEFDELVLVISRMVQLYSAKCVVRDFPHRCEPSYMVQSCLRKFRSIGAILNACSSVQSTPDWHSFTYVLHARGEGASNDSIANEFLYAIGFSFTHAHDRVLLVLLCNAYSMFVTIGEHLTLSTSIYFCSPLKLSDFTINCTFKITGALEQRWWLGRGGYRHSNSTGCQVIIRHVLIIATVSGNANRIRIGPSSARGRSS